MWGTGATGDTGRRKHASQQFLTDANSDCSAVISYPFHPFLPFLLHLFFYHALTSCPIPPFLWVISDTECIIQDHSHSLSLSLPPSPSLLHYRLREKDTTHDTETPSSFKNHRLGSQGRIPQGDLLEEHSCQWRGQRKKKRKRQRQRLRQGHQCSQNSSPSSRHSSPSSRRNMAGQDRTGQKDDMTANGCRINSQTHWRHHVVTNWLTVRSIN